MERGTGSRKFFTDTTLLSSKMRENVLRYDKNTEDLNHYLAEKMIEFHKDIELDIVITLDDYTLSSTEKYLTHKDMSSKSEKADARFIRHTLKAVL